VVRNKDTKADIRTEPTNRIAVALLVVLSGIVLFAVLSAGAATAEPTTVETQQTLQEPTGQQALGQSGIFYSGCTEGKYDVKGGSEETSGDSGEGITTEEAVVACARGAVLGAPTGITGGVPGIAASAGAGCAGNVVNKAATEDSDNSEDDSDLEYCQTTGHVDC
jgi:hypothetical protein